MNLEKFNKLGKNAQRVHIAKDVLKRISLGKFRSLRGLYSQIGNFDWKNADSWSHLSAKKVLDENDCAVCAKGALVMSWCAQFNSKTLDEVYRKSAIPEVSDIFSRNMRNAMEAAFEGFGREFYISNNFGCETVVGLKKPWSLRRVMQNIVDNEGNFKYNGVVYK